MDSKMEFTTATADERSFDTKRGRGRGREEIE